MIISDVFTYDEFPLRRKRETVLILSIDEAFKNKVIQEDSNRVFIGFAENSLDNVKDFAVYFKFFIDVLAEVDKVIIDGNFYSYAVCLIHSAAMNIKNVKEVVLYVDESNIQELKSFAQDPSVPTVISSREKTYSRQQFLDGGNIR